MMSVAVGALTLGASAAYAQSKPITIQSQALASALHDFGAQTGRQIMFTPESTRSKVSGGVDGATDEQIALNQLLQGTGLTWRKTGETYLIVSASDPQSGSAAGDGADNGTVQALIVTAQKREEDIQDVPIAISAFTQENLTRSQVAGGPDLMTQVPNMTFTKTNFSSYSIQIRGIGTQAISATTDAAVAVAFNNTPFIRNRFFEQEFYDLQRVEVLRGPQGTLYGRNATAGVVNLISQKPKFAYESKLSLDVGNYSSRRLEGMINLPLVDDKVALRLAGAWTKRDGYATNQLTGQQIDGRDLWSTRLSLRFEPTDNIHANLIWEHFQEDDDRLRSGKQLCHTDNVTEVAGISQVWKLGYRPLTDNPGLPDTGFSSDTLSGAQSTFSQGCAPASLYSPDSFETPNGFALPYYLPLSAIFLPAGLDDPYVSRSQSHDLRVIESTLEPKYRAKTDLAELQVSVDLTDQLSLTSETGYSADFVFSTQDYNRFNTAAGAWRTTGGGAPEIVARNILTVGPDGGIFCDPQLGCSDRLVAADLATSRSRQFSEELRLGSDFDGPFNFSLGANFLRTDSVDKYYVFINSLSLIAAISPYGSPLIWDYLYHPGQTDNLDCMRTGIEAPDYSQIQPVVNCTYIDPNPIGSLNDQGHNYFLSKNPYKLISYAVFGEAYYNITKDLKLTAGLRWTVDRKHAPLIPSWVLASNTVGYPVAEVVDQEWREPTGRLALDWKPDLSFTDETLVYGSYARGYKAGGANPPPYGVAIYATSAAPGIMERTAARPKTFKPEFVNAYELGTKNTLLDGRLVLNLAGFYYDYTGYQISQIIDRSAANMNFDSKVWGAELEADWRPLENLRLGLKLGYEKTRVADGMKAIDIMDRTAGHKEWQLVRPFPSIPSNCILPTWLYLGNTTPSGGGFGDPANPELVNLGGPSGGTPAGCELAYYMGVDPGLISAGKGAGNVIDYTAFSTNPADFPGWLGGPTITDMPYPGVDLQEIARLSNNGEGIFKDLSGNELPNAPHYTATVTADYTLPLPNSWLMTLHTDLYYQSEAWTRIFNTSGYDKLKAYTNVNLAAIFTNEDAGWKVMAYVKNVFDRDSITGAFLNSDDTGLTTNVFLTEPRLYGLRVTKDWTGGPWWTGANPNHPAGEPYPLTVELGGQTQRVDAPYDFFAPSFIGAFSPALTPVALENRDLDHGDNWQVKVAYRPTASPWQVSVGARYGRTNNATDWFHGQEQGDSACAFPDFLSYLCPIYVAMYGRDETYVTGTNFSDGSEKDREEHLLADFGVGRDVGLGSAGLTRSSVGLGLRYGQFKSNSQAWMRGIPNWDITAGWFFQRFDRTKYPSFADQYEAKLDVEREFKGAGPMLTWDASRRLLGSDQAGHLDIDWSVGGGVLFGKQSVDITGTESDGKFSGSYNYDVPRPLDVTSTRIDVHRSKSASVPVVDLSLGLAYEVQRVKVGAGYRWERYYNAVDGGADAHKSYDRTYDGPYFKIAVGFGG